MNRVDSARKQGDEWGKRSDNAGCFNEAVTRYRRGHSWEERYASSIFLAACLNASRSTPGFCDGVPQEEVAQWVQEQCSRISLEGDGCHSLYYRVQEYCERSDRQSIQGIGGQKSAPH